MEASNGSGGVTQTELKPVREKRFVKKQKLYIQHFLFICGSSTISYFLYTVPIRLTKWNCDPYKLNKRLKLFFPQRPKYNGVEETGHYHFLCYSSEVRDAIIATMSSWHLLYIMSAGKRQEAVFVTKHPAIELFPFNNMVSLPWEKLRPLS